MRAARITTCTAAALLAAAVSSPASADRVEYTGLTCGMVSTNDPSGVVEANSDVQRGQATGGPWIAGDVVTNDDLGPSPHVGSADITITCTVQVNNPMAGGAAADTVTGSANGTVFVTGGIRYVATPVDNVYLCTTVTMTHSGNTATYVFDEDRDPSNGNQCALTMTWGSLPTARRDRAVSLVQHGVVPSPACESDLPNSPWYVVCF